MKNKKYLKNYLLKNLVIICLFFFAFIVIWRVEYNSYKKNFNYKMNAILETVKEKYPDISDQEIIEILKSDIAPSETLKKYGYNIEKDSYIVSNDKLNTKFNILNIIFLIFFIFVVMIIFIKYDLKNDKEIDKIIKCIEDINHKNYELKIEEISEDKLSILKQEIYKTTIMLKESAENSLNDKINLKNSLQDISHQLKTPLTSINIMLDNIIDNPDMDEETRNYFIKQIKRDTTNITFLVQEILKLSKFEANTVEFIRDSFSIKEIIDEVVINVANLCDLKNITIEVNDKCNGKIICDFKWQIEALTNILKNAVEYSKVGSKVIINCDENNIYSSVEIKDFGKGMDEEDTLNIFKRFYRGKGSTKDSAGIGLALAKAIIEKDNGKIIVESKKDVGTTFVIKYFK